MACPGAPAERARRGAAPARRAAFEVLRRTFEHGAWTDRAFRTAADRHGLAGRDRAFAQRLAYGAVKRRGTTDHLAEALANRPTSRLDPPALAALRLGLYEVLFEGGAAHAAVGEAVELAKGSAPGRRRRAAAGLVNAVLRRASRDGDELVSSLTNRTPAEAALALSYPDWVVARLWDELGRDEALALLAAMNEPPERSLRVNRLRATPDEVLAALAAAGEAAASPPADAGLLAPPDALIAGGPWGPRLLGLVGEGVLVPQSRASQAVVSLVEAQPGERVLDLCAAPGMKSTALAAAVGEAGEVRSVEANRGRASELSRLAELLGARAVRVEVADASRLDAGAGYDRVLVDPPCTDLGALASRPDARWRKTADQAADLAALQGRILARGAAALRPGGTLVYSTCTISRAENEDVVAGLLAADGSLEADDLGDSHERVRSPHDRRFLQTRPDRDGTDGFFIARLRSVA
jgi:16S rRNA (cytosine967-C5)-methyltransferase